MRSGNVDVLALIGQKFICSCTQDEHPHKNRLRLILGLEAKNPVYSSRCRSRPCGQRVYKVAPYNGQRCTALKILYVHESIKNEFLKQFSDAVDQPNLASAEDGSFNPPRTE